MIVKGSKKLLWVICLCLHISLQGQSFIVDPSSIEIEETASNWQTTIITGFVLTGNYGFSLFRVEIPPVEVGFPIRLGETHDNAWIIKSRAKKDIGWSADKAAYLCAQRFIQNRAYYTNRARVIADFKRDMYAFLKIKIPGVRVQYEGQGSPNIERSGVRFLRVTYEEYLEHLGL